MNLVQRHKKCGHIAESAGCCFLPLPRCIVSVVCRMELETKLQEMERRKIDEETHRQMEREKMEEQVKTNQEAKEIAEKEALVYRYESYY